MTAMTRRHFLATLGKTATATAVAAAVPAWAAPHSDLQLISRQKGAPLLVALTRALERLTSTLTFMTTGAHPDDEPSALIAALRHHYGISPVIYCITRGEGGQNSIGPERGVVLGVLRTREMQEACRALDARLIFGGRDMHDSVADFGFSKDPHDTLHRWDEDIVVERMVHAIRTYRPDIVFNCFNDVPGQHGHHRAAVHVTDKAVALSADSNAFPAHFAEGLAVWDVPKLYDPAWGGGGSTYDDENPPPKETLAVEAPLRDSVSGATWPQMGEWSRACHLTQNMGRWIAEPQNRWPLSLRRAAGGAGGAETDIRDHLPATVGALADLPGMNGTCATHLREAQSLIDHARAHAAHADAVLQDALAIAGHLAAAAEQLPAPLHAAVAHRLARKRLETDWLIMLAAGVHIRSFIAGKDAAHSGEVQVSTLIDAPETVQVAGVRVIARPDLPVENDTIRIPEDAPFTNPMPPEFDPLGGNGDAYTQVELLIGGHRAVVHIDLEEALAIVPQAAVTLEPQALVHNRRHPHSMSVEARLHQAALGDFRLDAPPDWRLEAAQTLTGNHAVYTLTAPADVMPARVHLEPYLHGKPAWQTQTFAYPHTGRVVVPSPAVMPVQVVDAVLPESTIAYIGSNNDNIVQWLRQMGAQVDELDAQAVASGAFKAYDTLIIGVFAFGKRQDLIAALPAVHEWVKNGGHLLTLYHRPSDGWKPDSVPPAFLKIGTPSIRYRVTDENAAVTHLVPDHPLLNHPNRIDEHDWAGWDKERGLYFASEWDEAYVPLLAMNDPGEAPLKGALLSAQIGKGRHTHTALVLHHQLDKLTPGAYRLMANLLQKA